MTDLMSIVKAAPVIAQARSFTDLAKNITKVSDPLNASLSATKLIVEVCTPPNVKYPVKCTILALQVGMCVYSGGLTSVTSTALAIGTAKQVLEELA